MWCNDATNDLGNWATIAAHYRGCRRQGSPLLTNPHQPAKLSIVWDFLPSDRWLWSTLRPPVILDRSFTTDPSGSSCVILPCRVAEVGKTAPEAGIEQTAPAPAPAIAA